jgi:hypothetical protein
MERGFMADRYRVFWFAGVFKGFLGLPLMRWRDRVGVVSFRCTQCGYLENYVGGVHAVPIDDDFKLKL